MQPPQKKQKTFEQEVAEAAENTGRTSVASASSCSKNGLLPEPSAKPLASHPLQKELEEIKTLLTAKEGRSEAAAKPPPATAIRLNVHGEPFGPS